MADASPEAHDTRQTLAEADIGANKTANAQTFLPLWEQRGHILFLCDCTTIFAAFLLSYYLRFHLQLLAIKFVAPSGVLRYVQGAGLFTVCWTFLIYRDGGYRSRLFNKTMPLMQVRQIVICSLYALGLMMIFSFMYRDLLLSRQVYLMSWVMASVGMILTRFGVDAADRHLAEKGLVTQRIVLLGVDDQARELVDRIRAYKGTLRTIGYFLWDAPASEDAPELSGIRFLGSISDLPAAYERTPFDKMVIISSEWARVREQMHAMRMMDIINFCEAKGISFYAIPLRFDVVTTQSEVGSFSGTPMILIQDAALHPLYAVLKRAIDVTLTLMILAALLPLWLLIAILIKRNDHGPVFFAQERAGMHGQAFMMYKFRTMVPDAEERLKELVDIENLETPGFKIENDPRTTSVGRFLRRWSLDELPQLINVLKGEMSLVGPRPEMTALVKRYGPIEHRRLKAKPGITGYQQVMARGKPLSECVEYDLFYLKQQSFLFDLYILMRTIGVVISGSGITH